MDPRVPDRIAARRREAERRRARRRVVAAGLAGVCALAAVVVLLSGGKGETPKAGGADAARDAQEALTGKGAGSRLVANATPGPGWRPHAGPVPIRGLASNLAPG